MSALTRRCFARSASLLGTAVVVTRAWPRDGSIPIGAQLFTVRDEVQSDLSGTLSALKKIGFAMVEPFGAMYTRPPAELRRMIEDAGLTAPSAHFAFDSLERQLDYAHTLGVSYMVCAMLPKPYWNADGFTRAAALFDQVAAKARSADIKLAFHNHNFEFQPLGADPGDNGLRLLMDATHADLVSWEEDCYWVAQAGQSPLALLERYKKRVPLLHLKDRRAGATTTFVTGKPSKFFTEIGAGTIDWLPIIKIAERTGAKMFIEQDVTLGPPLKSLAISYQNLQKWLT